MLLLLIYRLHDAFKYLLSHGSGAPFARDVVTGFHNVTCGRHPRLGGGRTAGAGQGRTADTAGTGFQTSVAAPDSSFRRALICENLGWRFIFRLLRFCVFSNR